MRQRPALRFSVYLALFALLLGPGGVLADPTFPSGPISASPATSSGVLAASFSSLAITGVQPAEMTQQLTLATGATWLRLIVGWNQLKPTKGSFNWSAYDSLLLAAASQGYRVIATLRDYPAWTSTSSDPNDHSYQCRIDPSQFGNYEDAVRAIVGRYSAPPYNVTLWEMGNEPDNTDALNRYATMGCWGGEPYVDHYAQLLKETYPVIKGINPANQVIVGGLALDWFTCDTVTPNTPGNVDPHFLGRILADGAGTSFDLMNIHYYPNFRVRWEGYGTDIVGKLAWVRGVMKRHGLSQPIIVTEAGAVSNLYGDSTDWQSRFLVQLYSRAAAAATPITIWFNHVDETGDTDHDGDEYLDTDNDGDTSSLASNYGLYFDDGTSTPAKPAAIAFQRFATETDGATYVHQLSASDTGYASNQVEGYEYRGMASQKKIWVLWTYLDVCASEPSFMTFWGTKTDADRRTCSGQAPPLQHTVTFSQSPLRVLDMLGNPITLSGSPASVTVGIDPIYVEFADPSFTGLSVASPTAPTLASDLPPDVCFPNHVYVPTVAIVASDGW